jgi:hypothetical protein
MYGSGKEESRKNVISGYNLVGCLQYFGGTCCPHLHGTLKMEATGSSETLMTSLQITQCPNRKDYDLNRHGCENLKSHLGMF